MPNLHRALHCTLLRILLVVFTSITKSGYREYVGADGVATSDLVVIGVG